jgi:hypothetical protein
MLMSEDVLMVNTAQDFCVMHVAGCIGRLQHEEAGNVSWCTARFPTWAAADGLRKGSGGYAP